MTDGQIQLTGVGKLRHYFDRRPVLRFVSLVAVSMGLFYGLMATPLFGDKLFNAYLQFNAEVTAKILNVFGRQASVSGVTISTPEYGLEIRRGCDAVEPMALYIAGVIALATPMRTKVIGIALGMLVLLVVNMIRIVSLYYVGVYWRSAFETMHVDVWQPAFIVLTVGLWTTWALWATKPPPKPEANVSS